MVIACVTVLVRVRNTVTVVCETASRTTVLVVVNGPDATGLDVLEGAMLALITDLDKEGTVVAIAVVTLLWIDIMVVVDAGTLVVQRPLPRVNTAGPVTGPSKAILCVTLIEVVWFTTRHDSVTLPQASPPTTRTQFSTSTLSGTCPWAISYQGATKYASRSPNGLPCSTGSLDIAVVGTRCAPVEVEKVTDCPQSVTEIGREPSPESAVEHMAEDFRV